MIIYDYINLTKPNIVIGNLLSSIGCFFMASQGNINYFNLFNMSIGMTLIIAANCILNNIIDRDIDSIMIRTKNRFLAKKNTISIKKITIFAILLNILGFLFLERIKNLIIVLLSIIAIFVYIGIYSLWAKRKTIYSTIIGSISGSIPPVIGYCTVSNKFDIGACIILLIFSFWQIQHSYSITIFRTEDYQKALIPTFFIQKGIKITRIHMMLCIIGFSITIATLTIIGYTSRMLLFIISIMNLFWMYVGLYEYRLDNSLIWSRKMFFLSLIIILSLNLLLILDYILFSN